jgi:hypothetical protein
MGIGSPTTRTEENDVQEGFTFQTTRPVLAEPGASACIGALVGSRWLWSFSLAGAGLLEPAPESLKARHVEASLLADGVGDPSAHVVLATRLAFGEPSIAQPMVGTIRRDASPPPPNQRRGA